MCLGGGTVLPGLLLQIGTVNIDVGGNRGQFISQYMPRPREKSLPTTLTALPALLPRAGEISSMQRR